MFVNSWTKLATSSPKCLSMSFIEISVSSIVSCSKPETIEDESSFIDASILDTSIGWLIKGSPDFRFWLLWAFWLKFKAVKIVFT